MYQDQFQKDKEKNCKHDVWRCSGCGKVCDYTVLTTSAWDQAVKSGAIAGDDSWLMLPDIAGNTGGGGKVKKP